MSKGDTRRPSHVSQSQYEANWDSIKWSESCDHCWHEKCLSHNGTCCWCDAVMEESEPELKGGFRDR